MAESISFGAIAGLVVGLLVNDWGLGLAAGAILAVFYDIRKRG